MKAKHIPFILGLLGALSLTGCNSKSSDNGGEEKKEDIPASEQIITDTTIGSETKLSKEYFAVSPINLNMVVGGSEQLDVLSIPSAYSGDNLKFVSSDSSIVEVDSNGLVSAKAKGLAEIEVSTSDGNGKETVYVSVNEKIANTAGAEKLKEKGAAYRDASYQKASKVWVHELVQQTYKEGKDAFNHQAYVEDIIFDKENGYFEVYSDDIEIKKPDGSTSVSSGRWIFFVDQETFDTYLLHDTGVSKSYLEVHSQKYLGKPAYQVIYDILDMFFVSGKSIVTNYLDDVDGVGVYDTDDSNFIDCALNDYSNAKEAIYAPNDDDLYCHLEITDSGDKAVISPAEELSIDIPAGTSYVDVTSVDAFIKGNHVLGYDVKSVMTFTLDEVECERTFMRQQHHILDFDIELPDLSKYGKVDSMYDL